MIKYSDDGTLMGEVICLYHHDGYGNRLSGFSATIYHVRGSRLFGIMWKEGADFTSTDKWVDEQLSCPLFTLLKCK